MPIISEQSRLKKKIAVIFGTRPDAIKLAPVIQKIRAEDQHFRLVTIATAQHRQMLDDVLRVFKIKPQYDLNIMVRGQTLESITRKAIRKLDHVLTIENPDLVVVQGDTTTSFVASLAAFYRKIPVAHVEAGLRTGDKRRPFPEEMNRRLISYIADVHFAPTGTAKRALLREGVNPDSVFITGNTVIDALYSCIRNRYLFHRRELNRLASNGGKIVLITIHRRESWGEPLVNACKAIRDLALMYCSVNFVFPVHLNPNVRKHVYTVLSNIPNVILLPPLLYSDFVNLLSRSYFVMTDSGGIQEEAPALGLPVLVLREVTERPEAVKCGAAQIVGLETKAIVRAASKLLSDSELYRKMSVVNNPFGDGRAAERVVSVLKWKFGFSKRRCQEFAYVK